MKINEDGCCPFCRAEPEDECEHLFTVVDRTFCNWEGGSAGEREVELLHLIERLFDRALRDNKKLRFEDDDLQELWNEAAGEWNADSGYVFLDGDVRTRLEIRLLEDVGCLEFSGERDGGGPGMASALSYIYSEDPGEALILAINLLNRWLTISSSP